MIDSFGFDVTEEGKALGRVLAEEVAEGIQLRSFTTQSSPSTGTWPKNSEPYGEQKHRHYGWEETNYRTGQMLSFTSLLGKVEITKNEVIITYGTGEPPDKGFSPTEYFDRLADNISDDDKSFYAHTQGRGFFELDEEICEATNRSIGEASRGTWPGSYTECHIRHLLSAASRSSAALSTSS